MTIQEMYKISCDMDFRDYEDTYEEDLKSLEPIKDLFEAMRTQHAVMAEHDDNEAELIEELVNADAETLAYYRNMYL